MSISFVPFVVGDFKLCHYPRSDTGNRHESHRR